MNCFFFNLAPVNALDLQNVLLQMMYFSGEITNNMIIHKITEVCQPESFHKKIIKINSLKCSEAKTTWNTSQDYFDFSPN